MYAITLEFDAKALEAALGPSRASAYAQIAKELHRSGFEWKQGSVYFGNSRVDALKCVLAVQDLARKFAWFGDCVNDLRMLRVEERKDLFPAIERLVTRPKGRRAP